MILDPRETELDSRYFPLIFDAISQGIFTINSDGRITSFNRKAEEITGYKGEEVVGMPCCDIFQTDICEEDCTLKHSIRTGQQIEDREVTILTKDGRRLPIAMDGEPRVLIGISGTGAVTDAAGRTVRLSAGDTVLLPASCGSPTVEARGDLNLLWVDLPVMPAGALA